MLPAGLQCGGPVPSSLGYGGPSDDVVCSGGEGDQNQSYIETIGDLLRMEKGADRLEHYQHAGRDDHRAFDRG